MSFLAGMKVLKIFRESSARFESFGWDEILRLLESRVIILSFLAGMKVLKTFGDSSDHFGLFSWYESSRDF